MAAFVFDFCSGGPLSSVLHCGKTSIIIFIINKAEYGGRRFGALELQSAPLKRLLATFGDWPVEIQINNRKQ